MRETEPERLKLKGIHGLHH